jgi:hypothetical protein
MVIFFIYCKYVLIDNSSQNHFKKSTAFPSSCIKKNELNGPGSGISIRWFKFSLFSKGGLHSRPLYVHKDAALYWSSSQRGWQPQPIHGHTDAALYGSSSQFLFFIECFFTTSIKRDYGPGRDQSKKRNQRKLPDRTRCQGPVFGWSLVICHWSLGRRFGDMMRNRGKMSELLSSFLIVNCKLLIVNC